VQAVLENSGDVDVVVKLPQSGVLHAPAGSVTEVVVPPNVPTTASLALSLPAQLNTSGRTFFETSSPGMPRCVLLRSHSLPG
jgi:hypothetical protein